MTRLTIASHAGMGPMDVSVYPPGDSDTIEFTLSSGSTEHQIEARPGRYAIVARRPNGDRLRQTVTVTTADELVSLGSAVGASPNEFMGVETDRGQVARDRAPHTSPNSPDAWRAVLPGANGAALGRAVLGALAPAGETRSAFKTLALDPDAIAGATYDRVVRLGFDALRRLRLPEPLNLRGWRLAASGNWRPLSAAEAPNIVTHAVVSPDFLKLTIQRSGVPLILGLMDESGFGPMVSIPPFACELELTFLSKGIFVRASDRDATPGGQRTPVALVNVRNLAAADLLAALAAPTTPAAAEIWAQTAPQLVQAPPDIPREMLLAKFDRPAEALLAAHYLLRFMPKHLPISWADNLPRILPDVVDGPVIAAWIRLLNPPTPAEPGLDATIARHLHDALSRPAVLFARTRALLFDGLRLVSKAGSPELVKAHEACRRAGAEAGGLESYWGGGPTAPGLARHDPKGVRLGQITLMNGAFQPASGRPGPVAIQSAS